MADNNPGLILRNGSITFPITGSTKPVVLSITSEATKALLAQHMAVLESLGKTDLSTLGELKIGFGGKPGLLMQKPGVILPSAGPILGGERVALSHFALQATSAKCKRLRIPWRPMGRWVARREEAER